MEYRNLGQSGLKVSTLCLGAMTFGEADERSMMHQVGCDEATAHALIAQALEAGVNFIDTADIYGQDGLSERVLGAWFDRSGRRDEVVLATKFRFRMGPGPLGAGASRRRIVRACEDSLRRLRTDRIDLYQIHMQDLDTPEEETLRALDDLVRQGKVLYIGLSNYAAWRVMDSLWLSRSMGLERFVSMQMQYNLLTRDIEREHVPIATRFGLGILPWSPLAGGFLTGKLRRDAPPPEGSRLARWKDTMARLDSPRSWRILEALDAVSAELGSTPGRVALAWLLTRPSVTSVIFGARNAAQLEDNLAAGALSLPAEAVARLSEASAFDVGYPYDFIHRIAGTW